MALLDRVAEQGAQAPQLWPIEALNGLLSAERRRRITSASRHRLTGLLRALPIGIDAEMGARAWTDIARLAELHRLTSYEASYLELAQRLALPLATADAALMAAAGEGGGSRCCRPGRESTRVTDPSPRPSRSRGEGGPYQPGQSSRWTRSMRSWRSCASMERVAIGRASRRLRPIGSPVSSQ